MKPNKRRSNYYCWHFIVFCSNLLPQTTQHYLHFVNKNTISFQVSITSPSIVISSVKSKIEHFVIMSRKMSLRNIWRPCLLIHELSKSCLRTLNMPQEESISRIGKNSCNSPESLSTTHRRPNILWSILWINVKTPISPGRPCSRCILPWTASTQRCTAKSSR